MASGRTRMTRNADGSIQLGPGQDALPAAGHQRREALKARADAAEMVADAVLKGVGETYSVDPKKLEEEPEILKHLNFAVMSFEVSNPKPGYAYMWERKENQAIARKKAEARVLLGPNSPGWEVVSGGKSEPECHDLITAEGTREIGDVLLLRIPLESYTKIQKRLLLMTRFREANIAMKLSDFVLEHEGLVQVHEMTEDPRAYFAKRGTKLVHTNRLATEE